MRLYNLLILNKILKCNKTMSEQDLLVPSLTGPDNVQIPGVAGCHYQMILLELVA